MRPFSPLFAVFVLAIFANVAQAKSDLELLEHPARSSDLASRSILVDIKRSGDAFIAVGERGHIIQWQDKSHWQQHQVPVSVNLTSLTILPDGTKIAVGHDAVILRSEPASNVWKKVFSGYDLIKLKAELLSRQIKTLNTTIANTTYEAAKEDLEYQLEELQFSYEDTMIEQQEGPNKPLLSVTHISHSTVLAAGAYGTLLKSCDKGKTWKLMDDKLNNPDKYHLNSITTTTNGQLFLVGENGTGYRSTDQGENWTSMTLPYSGTLFGVIANEKSTYLVAYGLQGNLMVSANNGVSWQHKNIGLSISLLGGNFVGDEKVYLVGHGGLIISFDVNNLENINISKHPSSAAFSGVEAKDDSLILAGQFGMTSWQQN